MASLEAASYYLDDWDKIEDGYTKYLTLHEQHINILQQWLSKQPHLPKVSRKFENPHNIAIFLASIV